MTDICGANLMKNKNLRSKEEIVYMYNTVSVSYQNSPTRFPEHWHLSAEFILAMKDHCQYSIGKDTYLLDEGDILLIWPSQIHSVVSTPENASLLLQFDDSLITDNNDLNVSLPLLHSLHVISVREMQDLNQTVSDKMKEIFALCSEGGLFVETKVKIGIYQILIALCNYEMEKSSSIRTDQTVAGSTLHKIRNACAYITRNCDREITQQEVADYAGFSHYYFSRIFKEYTGESFSEYLAKQRINRAIQMLCSNPDSITEIAYKAGFQSISSFNRVFRLYMHCSPREYREMYQWDEVPATEASRNFS